jgi:hypothetical protein
MTQSRPGRCGIGGAEGAYSDRRCGQCGLSHPEHDRSRHDRHFRGDLWAFAFRKRRPVFFLAECFSQRQEETHPHFSIPALVSGGLCSWDRIQGFISGKLLRVHYRAALPLMHLSGFPDQFSSRQRRLNHSTDEASPDHEKVLSNNPLMALRPFSSRKRVPAPAK